MKFESLDKRENHEVENTILESWKKRGVGYVSQGGMGVFRI